MGEKARIYISEILLNDGTRLSINSNDIVLFVGANNAGKSQSLEDIYRLCRENDNTTIIIKDIKIEKNGGTLIDVLEKFPKEQSYSSHTTYNINNYYINYHSDGEKYFYQSQYLGEYREVFVSKLSTDVRLNICQPAPTINRSEPWHNPIHYAAFDYRQYGKWLSDSFQKAFGEGLIPFIQNGASIPLCIGETPKLSDEYDNEIYRQDVVAKILSKYKQVQNQGDGIKSFTGILLYLMLNYYCTFLIDEPESFLHPPQARIMGQILGESIKNNQQAFVSTHSEEFIKGLLDTCPERLKIIRISRDGDVNTFSKLDNRKIIDVFGDPLLKYSNIMSSLFHKNVILCESDADCKFYSIIDNHIKKENNKYSESLFIHCGGKQRMAKITNALRTFGINVILIPDMDVLNEESVIKGIAMSQGIDWNLIKKDYKILVSNVTDKSHIKRNEFYKTISELLCSNKDEYLSNKEIKAIKSEIKTLSNKWADIKQSGINAIPSGDATNAFNKINKVFIDNNIYIVPVGELEMFVREVGGHGPEWVNNVLERFPDLNSPVYTAAIEFIKSINI